MRFVDELEIVAMTHQTSVASVALAWLRAQPAVTSIIIGARPQSMPPMAPGITQGGTTVNGPVDTAGSASTCWTARWTNGAAPVPPLTQARTRCRDRAQGRPAPLW
ncbi:MAG: hypothetical protein QOJ80_2159 [Mycobacterium sp.]|nr:hypothetical protein [Mycobacterium sp.]